MKGNNECVILKGKPDQRRLVKELKVAHQKGSEKPAKVRIKKGRQSEKKKGSIFRELYAMHVFCTVILLFSDVEAKAFSPFPFPLLSGVSR